MFEASCPLHFCFLFVFPLFFPVCILFEILRNYILVSTVTYSVTVSICLASNLSFRRCQLFNNFIVYASEICIIAFLCEVIIPNPRHKTEWLYVRKGSINGVSFRSVFFFFVLLLYFLLWNFRHFFCSIQFLPIPPSCLLSLPVFPLFGPIPLYTFLLCFLFPLMSSHIVLTLTLTFSITVLDPAILLIFLLCSPSVLHFSLYSTPLPFPRLPFYPICHLFRPDLMLECREPHKS